MDGLGHSGLGGTSASCSQLHKAVYIEQASLHSLELPYAEPHLRLLRFSLEFGDAATNPWCLIEDAVSTGSTAVVVSSTRRSSRSIVRSMAHHRAALGLNDRVQARTVA